MWWLKNKRKAGEQVRTLTLGGVLDEQTFWQIVRAEKERADRSGMPVTVAVFTVCEDATGEHSMSGWNAAALCSALRSTARLTDHVGIAGDNELGVVLWGTRELGAYRFVNRLGEKAEKLASDCKLFVYPTLTADRPDSDPARKDRHSPPADMPGADLLERIAEVEDRLSQALDVETPVVRDEDVADQDEFFGYGYSEPDDGGMTVTEFDSGPFVTDSGGGTATLAPPPVRMSAGHMAGTSKRARLTRTPSSSGPSDVSPQTTKTGPSVDVMVEPLENLFLFPHPLWKRTLDIAGAFIGLILLSPVLASVSALIKLTSPGPVLFKQLREGHGGRLFTIYKFRTMRVGADAEKATLQAQSEQDGPAFKMEQDPRITPIGGFLRKTCLDELPQLWNVLIGDMTLVGPRPLDHRESTQIARWGRRRLHVMPGLTCIWQVHGKSKVSFNEWMRMDIRYSQKVSLWRDIKLMLATFRQMVLRKASH